LQFEIWWCRITILAGGAAGPGGEVVESGRGAEALINLSSVICKV
jgi:hypothetical protein